MREHPILFNGEMVRAILEGRKTQTRRVIKPQPTDFQIITKSAEPPIICEVADRNCPYGKPEDQLWVREAMRYTDHLFYDADGSDIIIPKSAGQLVISKKRVPSIFMPRWASRIQLLIKNINVERIKDITENNIEAEGVWDNGKICLSRRGFKKLWDYINKKRGFGWDTNPWVWIVEFERIK